MQIFKGILVLSGLASLAVVLSGCSNALIEKRVGADLVNVADAKQVVNCESKGKVSVSVLSKVGFIDRSSSAVDDNLVRMGRNAAIDAHGDTIVKGEKPDAGTQIFSIYKCH
jgi:hypothetical protein